MSDRSVPARRDLAGGKMLDLGQHRRQDESRRLRDLIARFMLPTLHDDRRMPTDEAIARAFRSTRNSARIALQMLVDERAIERTVGVGTYALAEPSPYLSDRLIDDLTIDAGTGAGGSAGADAGGSAGADAAAGTGAGAGVGADAGAARVGRGIRVIGWRLNESIPPALADQFAPDARRLAIFERVVLFGAVPSSIRTYYLPLRPGDEFELADASTDIFALLEERFGYDTVTAERTISAVGADPSAAELLGVPPGSPLLFIDTTVRSPAGDVVLTYHGRQRTDLVQLSVKPERIRD